MEMEMKESGRMRLSVGGRGVERMAKHVDWVRKQIEGSLLQHEDDNQDVAWCAQRDQRKSMTTRPQSVVHGGFKIAKRGG